jgi:predicted patatin/cPLA2 family phospholipase
MKSQKLHPVIKHLLARKHKKVPIKDGRKIALVLFGGAMAGVYGGGAMIALNELCLDSAFDEIYASSAGFCNASYLLSGNIQEGTSLYYEDLTNHKFIDFNIFWEIADIDYVVRCMKESKPLNVKNILSNKTKLFVQARNKSIKKDVILEANKPNRKKYFELMKVAIKIPFLSPGAIRVGRNEFKDFLQYRGNGELLQAALASGATDIVMIYNLKDQYEYLHKHFKKDIFENGRVLEIFPEEKSWNLSRFETDASVLKKACLEMGTRVKNVFGSKKPINLEYESSQTLSSW